MDQISQTKLLASVILFLMTLICGYLPVRVILNQNYVQYAMFAGGGVLMATAFCHLMPEAHDNYKIAINNFQESSNDSDTAVNHQHDHHEHSHEGGSEFPYLEVTLCCGFFFMYFVEQLMVRLINNNTHEHPCDTKDNNNTVLVGTEGPLMIDSRIGDNSTASSTVDVAASTTTIIRPSGDHDLHSITSVRSASKPKSGTELYKFIRGLLIISAFAAHSIFDGVSIGSQDTIEKVWTTFTAISCHKLVIAAVVGLELFATTLNSHFWTLVHISIFSIMSPIGIILVVVAQNSLNLNSNHPSMILLQSFATGTLLYIVFVEILQPKGDQIYEKNRFGKSFSLICGFVLMLTVLTLLHD